MPTGLTRSFTIRAAALAVLVTAGAASGDPADRPTLPTIDFSKPEPGEALPGGGATSRRPADARSFSHPIANLGLEREMRFKLGNALFKKLWVSAPSSTHASDGLGPLFNARSCMRCHVNDGRGFPVEAGTADYPQSAMLLRLSVPPKTKAEREDIAALRRDVVAEPTYGRQFQDFAIQGHAPEGKILLTYEDVPVALGDGGTVSLRKPTYELARLNYGPMSPDVMLSPRIATPMIGLGLLEAIDDKDILANADPDDADGNGISGRVRRVAGDGAPAIGRFGWKAGQATVRAQSAAAFSSDIGISTPLTPGDGGDCTNNQARCLAAPGGGGENGFEAGKDVLDLVAFYARNLAVPARPNAGDAQVLAGKQVFHESGCASCHVPTFVTRKDGAEPALAGQRIWPYSDLLLHDMGAGLADNRPEGDATGSEWRTAPLWGIGLTKAVSGHTLFLHDGRARSLLEAILWHGGEAEASKETVRRMDAARRGALIAFLESL